MKHKLCLLLSGMVLVLISCQTPSREHTLPVLGPKEAVVKKVNESQKTDTLYHTIPDFVFTNQDSSQVTAKTFEGKIYIADFFFTSCPTICPLMKTQMLKVYEKFKNYPDVAILSHTIDPAHDSVAVLREFAQNLGVSSNKWHFVTGEKEKIYAIGQSSYMVRAIKEGKQSGGLLHSGAFVLVDKQRRVRGIYDGTSDKEVDKLLQDIEVLLQEYQLL